MRTRNAIELQTLEDALRAWAVRDAGRAGAPGDAVSTKPIARAALALLAAIGVAAAALAAGPSYRLEVAGLACPFCAYGIAKKLHALDGVEHVETHIAEGSVIVTMKDGASLDEETARQAIHDAGFTLEGFTAVPAGSGP